MKSLVGKAVVITKTRRGIGPETTMRCAGAGANIARAKKSDQRGVKAGVELADFWRAAR